jgi:hypothetical protein
VHPQTGKTITEHLDTLKSDEIVVKI